MKKRVELPLADPIYSTYHCQGAGGAVINTNPSIRNWFLNNVLILSCSRRFLTGFTSPKIDIVDSHWSDNPYLEQWEYPMRFAGGYINPIIRNLLDHGYYVNFNGVDDYYVEGKSRYKVTHAMHDGLICGYDQEVKNYSIYAYDQNWVYRKFNASQESFDKGRCVYQGSKHAKIVGIKPVVEQVIFDPSKVYQKLNEYLDSSIEKYPPIENGYVFGIAVHDYIAMYLAKLYDGTIAYERMDRRVFRLIWEHKKAMLERLIKVEEALGMDPEASTQYVKLVKDADMMRMLYASHHMKRRDSSLPIIRKMLILLRKQEQDILFQFVNRMKGVLAQ